MASLPVSSAPAAAAADIDRLFADGENGMLTPPWSATENASVLGEAARSGTAGYQIDATQAPGHLTLRAGVPQGRRSFYVRMWVQLRDAAPGESVDLLTVENAEGVRNFDLFVTARTRMLKWDLLNTDSDQLAGPVVPGRWYLVEVSGSFGTDRYTAGVRVDGKEQGSIVSRGQKPTTVRGLRLGTVNRKTHRQWYDGVQLSLGNWKAATGLAGRTAEARQELAAGAATRPATVELAGATGVTPLPEPYRGVPKRLLGLLLLSTLGLAALAVGSVLARRRED